ncbi:MAG: bifunctional UDP-N-acetylglucosamine diphosphorylase/glucosamine-1-phosphate N-acetyltransferase GlmU [Candidatus Paracaedibacteraceae bacterium]|nr:bifunctional UDP-N-acetylglucosamine diphosphorylase/glucosamine-1-phosphate N-acetyltransferase GlmU [Candidatus Paracaedibacteraceae bacterium]
MTIALILAAGMGTRMNSTLPKVLHPLGGKAMIHHVIDLALSMNMERVIVVASPYLDQEKVAADRPIEIAVQEHPFGTGDAVRAGLDKLIDTESDILILSGDVPLMEFDTLAPLFSKRKECLNDPLVLAMHLDDPRQYGRLITHDDQVEDIVEYKDASPEQRAINLCNASIYLIPATVLRVLLPQLTAQNAAGELYLTDVIGLAKSQGLTPRYVETPSPETLNGINNRAELAQAEKIMQDRWRHRMMMNGVTLIDPASVFFSCDTLIGKDTVIHPNVTFGPGVVIESGATIYPFCHLEKCVIKTDANVGPFAHLRTGAIIGEEAVVGNFVEIKDTSLGHKAKVKHLSYLGNAQIGDRANIGAGTITCNYDGFNKSPTHIGNDAFIGSNTSLVAPLHVSEGAIVAAGSVITNNVPEHSLGIARQHQTNKQGWAKKFRTAALELKSPK